MMKKNKKYGRVWPHLSKVFTLLATVAKMRVPREQKQRKVVPGRRWLVYFLLAGGHVCYGQEARFNLTDVNISQAAAALQDFTGQAVVVASDVTGSISLSSSKPLDAREAIALFASALKSHGLALQSAAGELVVTRANAVWPRATRERESVIQTRIFTLQHLGVAEVSPAVRALLSRQGEISAKNNNTLIVSDRPSELLGITQYLVTKDRAKEVAPVQLACRRVLDAASVLEQHFAVNPANTVRNTAPGDSWGRQLRDLIHALENGVGCTADTRLAEPTEKPSLPATTAKPPIQPVTPALRLGERDSLLQSARVPAVQATVLPPARWREAAALPQHLAIAASLNHDRRLTTVLAGLDEGLQQAQPEEWRGQNDETRNDHALKIALENWRGAWSRSDVAAYLAFYAPDFAPVNEGSVQAWSEKRKAVFARVGEVSVDVADLSLIFTDATHATTVFTQTYRSRAYSDVVTKNLQWIYVGSRWLISRESVLKSSPKMKSRVGLGFRGEGGNFPPVQGRYKKISTQ